MKSCSSCGVDLILGENWTEARKKHHMNSCNTCNSTKSKKWKRANKEKAANSNRRSKVKYLYGLSREGYDLLYAESYGCCSICGAPEGIDKHSLHIDHDHATGEVRGLLCNNCNTGLGKFRDSLEILDKAKEYLIRSRREN